MDELDTYLEKAVVVDTATSFIYLGVLKQVGEHFVTLADVDVHDCNDGSRTKEIYVLEAKRFGIRQNRTEVRVRMDQIISVSLLDDVIPY